MTNKEIVTSLHKMVDQFAAHLDNPVLEGMMPTIRISFRANDDGDRIRLTVGVDFDDEDGI